VIIFGSIRFLSKKVTKPNFFLKKNQNRVKPTGFCSVRFGFLGKKPVQTGLARFFWFWLCFLGFGSVFSGFGSVWLGFGSVWIGFFLVFCRFRFGSVRFFGFLFIKPKPNRTGRFFQKFNRFNRFFFRFGFFGFFFPVFSV